ncbi:MAG: hypothetical protein Q4C83_00135 [Candidatus Saccharibacteria bacterium]|nr:hypothetical protein [Candidatus Saccharibacteria bacterium]
MTKRSIILNRMIGSIMALMMAVCGLIAISPAVNAASSASQSSGSTSSGGGDFLGFPTWYRNLPQSGGSLDLKDMEIGKVIIIIALNCTDMALRIVSIVAVCFVIWGGIQFVLARGEPGNIANARKTITFALMGLVIGMLSALAVGFASERLAK